MVKTKVKVEYYSMVLGSTLFNNTNGAISFKNKSGRILDLFRVEKENDQLLLSTEVKGENGKIIGKLKWNNFSYINENFDGIINPSNEEIQFSCILRSKETNEEIINCTISKSGIISVKGVFFIESKRIEISDSSLKIGNNTEFQMKSCCKDSMGKGIIICEDGISI
jgi:hypothetical protein